MERIILDQRGMHEARSGFSWSELVLVPMITLQIQLVQHI